MRGTVSCGSIAGMDETSQHQSPTVAARSASERLPLVATALLVVIHLWATWTFVGGWAGLDARGPFLNDDYTWRYYFASGAEGYLDSTGMLGGYDPNFMAGFARSSLFPSSTTPDELAVAAFGGTRPDRAFKVYVWVSLAVLPLLTVLAAVCWAGLLRPAGARGWLTFGAVAAQTIHFWSGAAAIYAVWGMVTYLVCAPLTVLAAGLLLRCGQAPTRWTLPAAALASAVGGLAHPCFAVGIAWFWLAAVVVAVHGRRRWGLVQLALVPAGTIVASLVWLLPVIRFRATRAPTGRKWFVTDDVWRELRRHWTEQPVMLTLTLLLVLALLWKPRWPAAVLAAGCTLLFALTSFGSLLPVLDPIQPVRYGYFLHSFAALAFGTGLADLRRLLPGGTKSAALLAVAVLAFVAWQTWTLIPGALAGRQSLATVLPNDAAALLDHLAERVAPGERVLFEAVNQGLPTPDGGTFEPMGRFRLAPLLPGRVGCTTIGGPYLYTQLATNFSQFGDGLFMAHADLAAERVAAYAQAYGVTWVVLAGPVSMDFFRRHPELTEQPTVVGRYLVARVPLALPAPRIFRARGGARVTGIVPAGKGPITLPLHWFPGLVSDPPRELRPVKVLDDPVPLVGVADPPHELWVGFGR